MFWYIKIQGHLRIFSDFIRDLQNKMLYSGMSTTRGILFHIFIF